MKRVLSTMSAQQLEAWRIRHSHTYDTGAEALGLARSTFAAYLAGEYPIPQTVALLCAAQDEIAKLKQKRR